MEKDYLDLDYEWDGCGDYDNPIVYSEQSEKEFENILKLKKKILRESEESNRK